MKTSDAYKAAQLAVLAYDNLSDEEKLFILYVLMDAEDLAKFKEGEGIE